MNGESNFTETLTGIGDVESKGAWVTANETTVSKKNRTLS
jgi:hypothetical protein